MSEVQVLLQVLISRSLVRVQEGAQNSTVVQLVRIHACHAWGHGFESRQYCKTRIPKYTVYINIRRYIDSVSKCGVMEAHCFAAVVSVRV